MSTAWFFVHGGKGFAASSSGKVWVGGAFCHGVVGVRARSPLPKYGDEARRIANRSFMVLQRPPTAQVAARRLERSLWKPWANSTKTHTAESLPSLAAKATERWWGVDSMKRIPQHRCPNEVFANSPQQDLNLSKLWACYHLCLMHLQPS